MNVAEMSDSLSRNPKLLDWFFHDSHMRGGDVGVGVRMWGRGSPLHWRQLLAAADLSQSRAAPAFSPPPWRLSEGTF